MSAGVAGWWSTRASTEAEAQRLGMRENAPITIVGGGVYGVATALALARRGGAVTVLEALEVAAGASGGLGKRGVRANGRDLRELPLMEMASTLWPRLSEDLGADTGYERTGHLRLYEHPHEAAEAVVRGRAQCAYGIPTHNLDRSAVTNLESGLSERIIGALHCPEDGVADHVATTRAYARAARASGVEIQTGARVAGLEIRHGRCAGLRLGDGRVVPSPGPVLLLANAGVPPLLDASVGVRLPVWTVYPQVVMSAPATVAPLRTLIGHASRPLAVKMTPGGAVMLSGGWRGSWDPEEGRARVLPEAVRGNWEQAVAVFPAIGRLEIAEACADRAETASVDGIPIIDRVPGVVNLLFATGWSGHGWAMAPAVALLLADWVVDGHHPVRLRPFGLDRFRRLRR